MESNTKPSSVSTTTMERLQSPKPSVRGLSRPTPWTHRTSGREDFHLIGLGLGLTIGKEGEEEEQEGGGGIKLYLPFKVLWSR